MKKSLAQLHLSTGSKPKKKPSKWQTIQNLAWPVYFYTQDLGRVFRVMEGLKYGLIGVNEGIITTVEAPFGGLKESGLGKEGGHQGIEGLSRYQNMFALVAWAYKIIGLCAQS